MPEQPQQEIHGRAEESYGGYSVIEKDVVDEHLIALFALTIRSP